jgi:hypothetical protein
MQSHALKRYTTTGHRAVHGWLSDTAVALLSSLGAIQESLGIAGPVCEIGIHHGRSFILLHLLTNPPERSVGWDLFELQSQNVDRSGRGDLDRLTQNLRLHFCDLTRIDVKRANSLDLDAIAVVQACGARPRIFSVDGGHTAEITFHDLSVARGSIKDEGLIVLDDFFNEAWPGVAEGAMRFFEQARGSIFPIAIGGNKLILTGSATFAGEYRTALRARLRRLRVIDQEFSQRTSLDRASSLAGIASPLVGELSSCFTPAAYAVVEYDPDIARALARFADRSTPRVRVVHGGCWDY